MHTVTKLNQQYYNSLIIKQKQQMKKQNRNVFAYVRQPNVQHNDEPLISNKSNRQSGNQTMFNQIVGQMDQQLTSYLNKLVSKNQKQEEKKKSLQKSVNHQRTKSYADIHMQTPSSSKNTVQKGHAHRGSHPSTQINNIFFSLNNTPTNQKPSQNKSVTKNDKATANSSFLQTLDTYITDLSLKQSNSLKKVQACGQQNNERKSIQKLKQNSTSELKLIQKLELVSKKQKQLKITNRILQSQNIKLKNKLRKNKMTMKTNMQQLIQYAHSLQAELKQEKRERKKLQSFISEFQEKFIMLRPERKTSGGRLKIQDCLLVSESTQQDDQHHFDCHSIRSKSFKKRKPAGRSTAKQSRISGLPIQDFSAMLAEKNFQLQDDDESENQL